VVLVLGIFFGALLSAWNVLLAFVPGMLVGAAVHAELYPVIKATLGSVGSFGKLTLPQLLGVNLWLIIFPLVAVGLLGFRWLERQGL
jgi:hypothetical protein